MMSRIWARRIVVLLLVMTPLAPGYAVAQAPPQPPVPNWETEAVPFDAVLYETTENLSLRALKKQERRKATSALLGFARLDSALCPRALVMIAEPKAQFCTLNSTGSDNISLQTGKGTFGGDVEITIQEVVGEASDGTPIITPDSPEVVIAKGRFSGQMDFSPAIVGVPDGNGGTIKLPFGTVEGFLSLDRFSKRVPFTGIFRLPFVPADGFPPMYLGDNGQAFPVQPGETAIGYPTVRFEISF